MIAIAHIAERLKKLVTRVPIYVLCLILSGTAVASDSIFSYDHVLTGIAVSGVSAIYKACHDAGGHLRPECKNHTTPSTETPAPLLRNPHTDKLRKALNIEQVAADQPSDPENCDAHHIVPKNEGRVWASKYAKEARAILESCQIDLDSADNGIYLPGKAAGAQCSGSYHKTLHTAKYYEDITLRLSKAGDNGCDQVAKELRLIKHDLLTGKY